MKKRLMTALLVLLMAVGSFSLTVQAEEPKQDAYGGSSLGEDELPLIPTEKYSLENCLFTVTIPADHILRCFKEPDSYVRYRNIAAETDAYELTCTQKVKLSNGTTRYGFYSEEDGMQLYFAFKDTMTVVVLHDFTEAVTEPTCTEGGYTAATCTCGYSEVTDPTDPKGHTVNTWSVKTPATCKKVGEETGTCIDCRAPQTREIPMTDHSWTAATCTAPKTCSVCAATEGTAKGHSWTAATCTAPKTCSVCAATEGTAKGHSWQAATCTVPKTCSACGITEGASTGHSWEDATCTEPKTCTTCGATVGDALGHSWKNATCTDPKTCSVCRTTEGSAKGHSWKDATCTLPKTCSACQTTEGAAKGHDWDVADCTKPRTCKTCKKTEGAALGHSWQAATCTAPKTCSSCKMTEGSAKGHSWQAATCTAPKTCDLCKATEGAALGHKWQAATCTTAKTCSVCEATDGQPNGHDWDVADCTKPRTCKVCSRTEGAAQGHSWVNATCTAPKTCPECKMTEGAPLGHKWQAATCTAAKTCSVCKATEGAALGHKWTAATCTAAKTCSVCKITEGAALGHSWRSATCTIPKTCRTCKTTEGAALGHSWVDATCTTARNCPVCHATEGTFAEHRWDAGVVTKEPSTSETGVKTFTCSACKTTKTEDIPKLEASVDGVTRLAGADRYKTAFLAADMLKAQLGIKKFDTVVVASGTEFADALSGSYLAAVKDAPMLLVRNNKTTLALVKDYIKANLNPGGTVYILGGVNAVPKAMETGLDGFQIKRLGGNTRYDTNLLILKEAGVGDKDILVCTGKGFADSLSASAAERPILLVKDSFTSAQKDFLKTAKGKLYIIGGTSAVSAKVEASLKSYGTVKRLGGNTRYETSVMVAQEFFHKPTAAVLAYAQNFPDGLSGGALAAAIDAPLILTMGGKDAAAAKYTKGLGIQDGFVLGGPGLINDNAVRTIFQMALSDNAKPHLAEAE